MEKESNSDLAVTLGKKDRDDVNYRLKAGLFLTSVTGISAIVAFGMTLAAAKKRDPVMFEKGSRMTKELQETGVDLAMRALKWGTFYAVSGCSLVGLGVWTLSGASNLEEFRYKMGSILPQIKKNDPPIGRTDFSGMNDLLHYLSEDYQKDTSTNHKPGTTTNCAGCSTERDLNDKEILEFLQQVIAEKNKQSNEDMTLVRVVRVSCQVVAGVKCTVDFEGTSNEGKAKLCSCHTEFVSQPWLDSKLQILKYKCLQTY